MVDSKVVRSRVNVALATFGTLALVAGCSSSHHSSAPTTVSTTIQTTTTTTVPPVSPLTGLPQPNAAQLRAPAVVVKIDNIDAARPQTGLNQADIVYEELVEGGLTRLAAVYQSQYPTVVGPVRSGRLTDEGIADDLNHPVFAYSGTNAIFLPVLRSQPIVDIDDENRGDQFYRTNFASPPHNLYTNVVHLAANATAASSAPTPLFAFFSQPPAIGTPGVTTASRIGVNFQHAFITWTWAASSGLWTRTQNGTTDVDRAGQQLSAQNVIVQNIPYSTNQTGYESGVLTVVPAGNMVGAGQAWYFSDGRVIQGKWSRSSLTSVTSYVDASGNPIQLMPGRTWIELLPQGSSPVVTP